MFCSSGHCNVGCVVPSPGPSFSALRTERSAATLRARRSTAGPRLPFPPLCADSMSAAALRALHPSLGAAFRSNGGGIGVLKLRANAGCTCGGGLRWRCEGGHPLLGWGALLGGAVSEWVVVAQGTENTVQA